MWASVCLPASLSVSVSELRPSTALFPNTPLRSASKKQGKQQSAVVDSNRAYKQHHKSSLQTSNSIQLRFGLSHLHLSQVRQDSATQPLTVLAVVATVTLWLLVWKQFLCLAHSSAMRPLTYSPLFSCVTQPKKTTRTGHIHLIKSSFPSTTTTLLFKASFQPPSCFYIYSFLLQSKRSPWNQPFVP